MAVVSTDASTYKAAIPSDRTGFSFVRMDPSKPAHEWGSKWNQTVDLTFKANPCYKVTSWDGGVDSKSTGDWEAYEEPVEAPKYYYSLNDGADVLMSDGTDNQVVSESLSFQAGDTLTFKKDSSALAVTPKDDDAYTKVELANEKITFVQNYSGALYLNTVSNKLWAGELDRGFYLNGTFSDWDVKHAVKAVETPASSGIYVAEGMILSADDEVKFIEFKNEVKEPEYKDIDPATLALGGGVDAEISGSNSNLKFNANGTYNLSYNSNTGAYSVENPSYVPDVPAQEGYYICGEFSSVPSWRYENATKMTNTSEDGNVAYQMDFVLAVGDEFRVRSYYNDRDPKDQWADVGIAMDVTSENKLFTKEGDNLKCVVAGHYDIYAKYEDADGNEGNGAEQFAFYATPHVDSYTVTMVGVKFAGGTKEATFALADQVAYAGGNFNPTLHAQDGYVTRGVYTNEACTQAYTAHELDAATTLYVKYTKVGYYVISEAGEWSIDNAALMNTQGIGANNKAEALITVAAANERYSCVYYNAAGEMSGQSGLGADYKTKLNWAEYDNEHGNIKFLSAGTYAIYWASENNLVYLNAGKVAFCTNFISEIGGVCKEDNTTDLTTLKAKWAEQEIAYSHLSADEKKEFTDAGFDGGDPDSDNLVLKVIAKYHYIVWKYGSAEFKDFIFNSVDPIPAHSNNSVIDINNITSENNTILVVTVLATIIATAGIAYLGIRLKRKEK